MRIIGGKRLQIGLGGIHSTSHVVHEHGFVLVKSLSGCGLGILSAYGIYVLTPGSVHLGSGRIGASTGSIIVDSPFLSLAFGQVTLLEYLNAAVVIRPYPVSLIGFSPIGNWFYFIWQFGFFIIYAVELSIYLVMSQN